jgi:hypothetical protein
MIKTRLNVTGSVNDVHYRQKYPGFIFLRFAGRRSGNSLSIFSPTITAIGGQLLGGTFAVNPRTHHHQSFPFCRTSATNNRSAARCPAGKSSCEHVFRAAGTSTFHVAATTATAA